MEKTKLLTYQEAAQFLGMKRATLYCYVCQKRIPHYRTRQGRILFKPSELTEWQGLKHIPENETVESRAELARL